MLGPVQSPLIEIGLFTRWPVESSSSCSSFFLGPGSVWLTPFVERESACLCGVPALRQELRSDEEASGALRASRIRGPKEECSGRG